MTRPEPGHGAQHPLCGATGVDPWHVAEDLWAWRLDDGSIVLQDDTGDVTIPPGRLPLLARSLLAVHVHNGRPEFREARAQAARREAATGPLTADAAELPTDGTLPPGSVPLP